MFCREGSSAIDGLLAAAQEDLRGQDVVRAQEKVRVSGLLQMAVRRACEMLGRWRAVPIDAPAKCRCDVGDNHSFPAQLAVDLVDVTC